MTHVLQMSSSQFGLNNNQFRKDTLNAMFGVKNTEFCVYEGPKDNQNYYRYFKLIAEDYTFVRFYEVIKDKKDENKLIDNRVTCLDTAYEYNVTLENRSDFRELDEFLLYRFVFRKTIKINENLWTAARKQRQPLLVYLRDAHYSKYSHKQYYVHHEVGKNQTLKEEFYGQRDMIDFVLHRSYEQLIDFQDGMKRQIEEKEQEFLELASQGKASSMKEEKELMDLRKEHKIISKNIVYTYCDFVDDTFAKKLFDQLDIPIHDRHLPSLIIFDFLKLDDQDHLSGEMAKTYHFPANDPYGNQS